MPYLAWKSIRPASNSILTKVTSLSFGSLVSGRADGRILCRDNDSSDIEEISLQLNSIHWLKSKVKNERTHLIEGSIFSNFETFFGASPQIARSTIKFDSSSTISRHYFTAERMFKSQIAPPSIRARAWSLEEGRFSGWNQRPELLGLNQRRKYSSSQILEICPCWNFQSPRSHDAWSHREKLTEISSKNLRAKIYQHNKLL